jgi:hypothetical protein
MTSTTQAKEEYTTMKTVAGVKFYEATDLCLHGRPIAKDCAACEKGTYRKGNHKKP